MNIKAIIYIVFLGFGNFVYAQNYVIYDVKPDDTPQSIAQTNSISLKQLYQYNPDLRNTSSIGQQKIVIPKVDNKNFGLFRYRVKTKETLYSISKNFNLSIADIKAFNPQLYNNELRAGEVLKLPAYKLPEKYQNVDFNQSIKNSNFTTFKHIVLPNERKSDIVEKYGMNLKAFDSLNPNIIEVQSGQLVKVVPTKSDNETINIADLDMKLQYYKVPRQQTLYSLTKEFKISEDIIFKLNPIVRREGLKAGMIIKLPEKVELISEKEIINLENYIQNFNEKKLALFLPFSLYKLNNDSISPKSILMKDNLMNVSLEMYQGVQWAIEHAKSKGIYTDLKVFDTKRNPQVIDSILLENNLSDRDVIIGPVIDKNVKALSDKLELSDIPIFLPLTKSQTSSAKVFNTLPEQDLKVETLITYIDSAYSQKQNLIFITDSTAQDAHDKYKYTFPNAKFLKISKTYVDEVEEEQLINFFQKDVENHVILDTDQIGVSENVVNFLYKFQKGFTIEDEDNPENSEDFQFDIRLYTSDRNRAFGEKLDNKSLCVLRFIYISASKYDVVESNSLIEDFIDKYGYAPSRYVLRGFDLTYDILLRLAYSGDLKDTNSLTPLTEYNENRFGYDKTFLTNVYDNTGLYIIQYQSDFEVKILNSKSL